MQTNSIDGYRTDVGQADAVINFNMLHDPGQAAWTNAQANYKTTLLASAVRTADTPTAAQLNKSTGGATVFLDVTANASAESFTIYLQAQDPVSTNWVNLANSGVLTSSTGTFAWQPAVPLPLDYRYNVDTSAGNNKTYSLAESRTRTHL